MPARKIRIELFDREGNKYTMSFEGKVTRDKAIRLLDLVELLGGVPGEEAGVGLGTSITELTKYDRVRVIIQNHFPIGWFTSREVQSVYEREIKEPMGLSTVSTYLSRLAEKGILSKAKASRELKYHIVHNVQSDTIERRIYR